MSVRRHLHERTARHVASHLNRRYIENVTNLRKSAHG